MVSHLIGHGVLSRSGVYHPARQHAQFQHCIIAKRAKVVQMTGGIVDGQEATTNVGSIAVAVMAWDAPLDEEKKSR